MTSTLLQRVYCVIIVATISLSPSKVMAYHCPCDNLDNNAPVWMRDAGRSCTSLTDMEALRWCVHDANWIRNTFCRRECHQLGYGYAGDVCECDGNDVPVDPSCACQNLNDDPSQWMLDHDYDCRGMPADFVAQHCNSNDEWRAARFCARTCFRRGSGYQGDYCHCDNDDDEPVDPPLTCACENLGNNPPGWMNDAGKTCESMTATEAGRFCISNENWRGQKFCRRACHRLGFGYEGDHCECGNGPVDPPPGDDGSNDNDEPVDPPLTCACENLGNNPPGWMNNAGRTCESMTATEAGRFCISNENWRQQKFCRRACHRLGFGYEGDHCECGNEPVDPRPGDDGSTECSSVPPEDASLDESCTCEDVSLSCKVKVEILTGRNAGFSGYQCHEKAAFVWMFGSPLTRLSHVIPDSRDASTLINVSIAVDTSPSCCGGDCTSLTSATPAPTPAPAPAPTPAFSFIVEENFGDKNLTTTGALNVGTMTIRGGQILDSSGTVRFSVPEVLMRHVKANVVTTLSDGRLKTNITTLESSTEIIEQLRGVRYEWKSAELQKTMGPQIGVIAQEVEAVVPEVVRTGKDGIKSVEYAKMVALLIESVKELSAEVRELKARLGE